MRVVLLTTSYPTSPGDPSGHFVQAHVEELAHAGADVTVLAPAATAPPGAFGPGRICVRALRGGDLFSWPGAFARLRERPTRLASLVPFTASVVSALREAGPVDRLVAHWLIPCASLLALLGDAPLEAWAHGADVRALCRMPALARRAVASTLVDRGTSTSFVFVSHDLRARLLASLPAATAKRIHERSRVTPAPIRVPARAALADPRLPGELEGGYVVWVGRQIPSKRPAAAARAATSAGLPLVMIGDGPLTPPSGAVALGRLTRHDTLRWIAHARALVSTSQVEGAPTVVREARALGVPVVARPCGDLERWASLDGGIHLASDDDDVAVILRRVALSA